MKYLIKVKYLTGDSGGSHETTDYLEYEWDKLDYAEASLDRIKGHIDWYRANQYSFSRDEVVKPSYVDDSYDTSLWLFADDGSQFQYNVFWLGIFERPIEIGIELKTNFRSYSF